MLRLELVEVNRSLVRKNAGRSVKFRSYDGKARVRKEVLYDNCEVSKNKPLTENLLQNRRNKEIDGLLGVWCFCDGQRCRDY